MVCKKIFMFLILGLFMISFASAWDGDNVYDYNEQTKTATVENWLGLGPDLAYITLTSPQNVRVVRGNDRLVGEFNFTTTGDFIDTFGDIYLKDMKSGNEISRGKQFKYKKYKNVSVDDYETTCEDMVIGNGTIEECTRVEVGSHWEIQMDWIPIINPTNIFYEDVTYEIGVFVDVEEGDYGDWIPSIMGVEIEEWAKWTEDLNVDLLRYYKLDETSGDVIDNIENQNGTNVGATRGVIGKINNSFSFDGNNDYVNIGTIPAMTSWSVSGWIYPTTITTDTSYEMISNDQAGFNDDVLMGINVELVQGITDKAISVVHQDVGSSIRTIVDSGEAALINTWYHVVATSDGSTLRLYVNGSLVDSTAKTGTALTWGGATSHIGDDPQHARTFNGRIDEMAVWDRTLNQSSITQLYNENSGITWTDVFFEINTTLNEPENNTVQNDATLDFNWTITPTSLNITNWTLNVWLTNGTLAHQHINTTINTNETTTVIHNDTLFLDESYIWNVESCGTDDIDDTCDLSNNWTFTLDTAPPEVNITYPPEGFIINTPLENITLNYTVVHPVGNLSNCFYNTTSSSTPINLNCTANTTSFLYPVANPNNLTIYVFANDTASNLGSDNVTIFKDTVGPTINVTTLNGTLDYNYIGNNETLNVTFSDSSLDFCWYNYNGTNITIDGCLTDVENSTQFILEEGNLNMTIYANDSLGNTNSTFIEWDYIILEYSTTYDSEITEGETNQISTKILIGESESITSSVIVYGGVNYTTSVIYDGTNYTIVSNNNAPIVASDTNFSFNFIVSLDGTDYNTTTNNQTVNNLDFGVCGGVSNDTLLNMSLFNEETLTSLVGDIEFNAEIISKSSNDVIEFINATFNNTNSGDICFSPVSSYNLYYLDAEIRYFSDGYTTEFYYIQNSDMAEYPRNLSLFDLNQNDSTEFSVTYKNNAFIFEEDAVIQLQRKYIGEGIYRVVEAPITGDGGKAILHIDLNTNKYQASVVKDGELLDFFDNIVFSCDNELSGDCTHSLDGTVDPNNDVPIEDITDFVYSVSVDEDNQEITVLFAVPSGTPSTINVVLDQIDMFGNLTSCNTTIITSAGSITCDYTDTIEKSILELSISKDDVQLAVLSYVNDPDLDMDGMNFFIVFLFMISLVGMAIASPEWMVLISVVVLIISGTLLLLKGMSLVMGLGAIAWVVVAAAIIIMKMSKQEDR